MKTKEELNVLKEGVEALSKKLAELSEEELAQVSGGSVDDVFQRYNEDILNYMRGLLNPEEAYRSTLYRKDPNPLGDVT